MTPVISYDVTQVPMEEIFSDSDFNCRGHIIPLDVLDLTKSIQSSGLQYPITVTPFTDPSKPAIKYRIVAGHRRHLACKINKMTVVPCMVRKYPNEMEMRLFNLVENLERKQLNVLQEAKQIAHFVRAGWTEESIADKTGQSRGWVQVRRILLRLPEEIQKEAATGLLSQTIIRQLGSMKSAEDQFKAVRLIKDRKDRNEVVKNVLPARFDKPHQKKLRNEQELLGLQDYIQEQVGNSIVTRLLGWATGNVSNYEIYEALREWYKTQNKPFTIPRELLNNL
jgi:ParB/RepB/Spo0J family partition protein